MATLYTHAESNILKTWFYMSCFFVLIIAFGWLISYYFKSPGILYIAIIFSVLMSFFSYWYSDKIVLAMAKAKEVKHDENPEIYHIVENLCITAGLPLPKIYIINEDQPNAFATGRDAKHAVVAVTAGLLRKLEKSELEGVLAHELSHIGNKDMLLSTVVVILAGIIAMISDLFIRMSFLGERNNDSRDSSNKILLILTIIACILAPLAATLIRLAISRKREFLADASGALLTRYPDGLANALEKISSDKTPMRVANNSFSHLWVSDPFKGKNRVQWFHKLFLTHPPVEERIRVLRAMNI